MCGLASCGSGLEPVTGSCEYDNEFLGGGFIDQLSDCQHLKKGFLSMEIVTFGWKGNLAIAKISP
jgi:hypothetical protein